MSKQFRSLPALALLASTSLLALGAAPLALAAPSPTPTVTSRPTTSSAPTATSTPTKAPTTSAPTASETATPTTTSTATSTPTASAAPTASATPQPTRTAGTQNPRAAVKDPSCNTDPVQVRITGATPGQEVEAVVFQQGTSISTRRTVKADAKGTGAVTLPVPYTTWKPGASYLVWIEGGQGAWLAKHAFDGPGNACRTAGTTTQSGGSTSAPATSTTKDTTGGLPHTGV